jgi:diacylglycerol kinase family enzyme
MMAAAKALAGGLPTDVDIGEVNGRLFIHHVTLGLHARMILVRTRLGYTSRHGKMWASCKAWWMAVRDPPNLVVHIRADREQFQRHTAAVLVTNNPLGEGHIPYADDPRQGELGLYIARSLRWADLLSMAARMLLGNIAANPLLEARVAEEVDVALAAPTVRASVDGELEVLDTPLCCRLHRGGLSVLKPSS